MSHVLSSYLRRITNKAHRARRKMLSTAKVTFDPHVPILTFYNHNSNWGDALNLVLVKHISGRKAVAAQDVYNFRKRPVYSVIGSILGNTSLAVEVWGSGFIASDRTFQTAPNRIYAVRGPLTRNLVLKQGLSCPTVYGDPALLYPRYYAPAVRKEYDVGIVAHYMDQDSPLLNRVASKPSVLIIDVLSGVREFVDQLCSCRHIASSSLHGLIAADAYGIPFTWISLSNRLIGKDFKFRDYFLSTGRHDVESVELSSDTSLGRLYDFAVDPHPEIDLDLLFRACPFAIDALGRD